jgi:D-mycarose 3-C-methyltransferase
MHGHPDIVTFTNVFAHIDNLPGLLTAVKALLGNETTVVIENHYLGAILERNQFDTFYHEHPRTYSFTSFKFIAGKLGMRIADVEFPSRYGGNIRVTLDWGSGLSASGPREHDMLTRFDRLRTYVATWTRYKSTELRDLFFTQGRINCIAFPGRAAILMRLLNIPDVMWGNVYEKPGSKKIGYYVPGTHVPIVSDALYPMDSVKPLVNLAWHIPKEIEHRWRLAGFHGTIIQVVDAEDFRA